MEDSLNSKGELLCKVCGDKASGKHYGVSSCDGCRGFFKRSIRRNLEYVCKESGRCVVDVTRRNQCQACRFRKCLQVNMKRDAVQHERAPRTTIQASMHHYPTGLTFGPRLRTLQGSPFFAAAAGLQSLPLHLHSPPMLDPLHATSPAYTAGFLYPNMLGGFLRPTLFSNNNNNNGHLGSSYGKNAYSFSRSLPQPFQGRTTNVIKEDEVSSSEEANVKIIDVEYSKESPGKTLELPLITHNNISIVDGNKTTAAITTTASLFPAENIYESAAKLLFLSIKWARTIPSFLQLSYRDQSILLEECWHELFILTAAQWALSIDEAILLSNAVVSNNKVESLEEDGRKLKEVINRLTLLRVDHTEHACLKALVLFKPECRGLCDSHHVEVLQDQTHMMLNEYCVQKQQHKGRFGKLLLTLPAVQSVSRRGLEELLFRQTVGDVAIDRLLGDLAKATQSQSL